MEHYTQRAAENTRRAKIIIDTLDLHGLWHAIGAEVQQVGSMRMGLLAKHRDLDFHIYSDAIDLRADFEVMGRLAALPGIVRIEYGNLLDTDEACVEWHAWYRDETGDEWQIDLIHIVRGSRYDGYFERVADRIAAALTNERREAILRLKFETPDDLKIMSIEYYQAVIRDGVRTWDEFAAWRQAHPVGGIVEWEP
ncbi:MAG: phosphoglycerate mutase family protein [Alistipes sp.]|nr:phosphoglycerate mutase family protein [Alistipes sp.]